MVTRGRRFRDFPLLYQFYLILLYLSCPFWIPCWVVWRLSRPKLSRLRQRTKALMQFNTERALLSTVRSCRQLKLSLKRKTTKLLPLKEEKEQKSPLVNLPVELQFKIWRMVYEDMTVHVVSRGNAIRSFACNEKLSLQPTHEEPFARYAQCQCLGSALVPAYRTAPAPNVLKRKREKRPPIQSISRVPGLHLTCRQLYDSSIEFLYNTPTFDIPTQRLLSSFVAALPPSRVKSISSLNLHTWDFRWFGDLQPGFSRYSYNDKKGPHEWSVATALVAGSLTGLRSFALVVHAAGGSWMRPSVYMHASKLKRAWEERMRGAPPSCYLVGAVEKPRRQRNQQGQWSHYTRRNDWWFDDPTSLDSRPPLDAKLDLPEGWSEAVWCPVELNGLSTKDRYKPIDDRYFV